MTTSVKPDVTWPHPCELAIVALMVGRSVIDMVRIDARHASRLVGQQRLDNAPLEVGQIVSAHADAESGFHPMGKTASL